MNKVGYSQEEMASVLNLSATTISRAPILQIAGLLVKAAVSVTGSIQVSHQEHCL